MSRLRIQFEGSLPWHPIFVAEALEELFRKKSEQEHIDFMKQNNLKSSSQWLEYHKDNNLKEQGYYHSPGTSFAMKKESVWFAEVRNK